MAILNNQMVTVIGQFSRRQDAPFMLGLREKMGAIRVGGKSGFTIFLLQRGKHFEESRVLYGYIHMDNGYRINNILT